MVILVADDHGLFREGMQSLVEQSTSDYRACGAASLTELKQLLMQSEQAHLIMLDLNMPGMEGVASIQALARQYPDIPILVVSAEESPTTIQACIQAGAAGFVGKSSDMQIMKKAIQCLLAGGQFIPASAQKHRPINCTHQQEKIMRMLIDGRSNLDIAKVLHLTEGTVKQYVSGILTLLNVDNRTQAAAKARQVLGLVGS